MSEEKGKSPTGSTRRASTTAASSTSPAASAQRRSSMLENLMYPVNKDGKNSLDIVLTARRNRPAFSVSPAEREINRVSKSGRQLSELEILQEKHEPEFKQIVPSIAEAINAVLTQHGQLKASITRDDRFAAYETSTVPGIAVEDYVHRIAEYTYVSPATMLASLIFLDRLCQRHNTLLMTSLNIFKLFFVAVRVASKVVDLRTLNNKNFASVGGVSNRHLNDLEARFLIDLRFDLFLSPTEFHQYASRLQPHQPNIPRNMSSRQRPGLPGTTRAPGTDREKEKDSGKL